MLVLEMSLFKYFSRKSKDTGPGKDSDALLLPSGPLSLQVRRGYLFLHDEKFYYLDFYHFP